jgi:hypothetical protein
MDLAGHHRQDRLLELHLGRSLHPRGDRQKRCRAWILWNHSRRVRRSQLFHTLALSLAFAYLFFGPATWVCSALATIFGMLAIERTARCVGLAGLGIIPRTLVVAVAIAAAPILPILSTGMEHCMHIWAVAGLLSALMASSAGRPVRMGIVFLWAVLAAGSRYESMFFLPGLMILLTLSRRWQALVELAGGMGAVAIGFGLYSTAHGGFFSLTP